MADDKTQFVLRMDAGVLDQVDARAKDVGLSRNEWFERCARWVIHNLPYRADGPVRVAAAMSAPAAVAGNYSVDMGLDGPEGK